MTDKPKTKSDDIVQIRQSELDRIMAVVATVEARWHLRPQPPETDKARANRINTSHI